MQSRRAFLLLEALFCLLLFSFALCLFLRFNATPKNFSIPLDKTPFDTPQFFKTSQKILLKNANLEFEAVKKIWDDGEQSFVVLEEFK